jgi:hypothetical protein
VLVVAGIIGFFYEASFATGDSIRSDDVFGVLAVNGWHDLVHIAIGAVLLLAAGSAARGAALWVGLLYIVLCVLGFIATSNNGIGFVAENDTLLKLVPVNNEDNVLHLILGITGVIAAFATRPARRAAPAT